MSKPDFKNLNAVEVAYEIPMTLEKLMNIYRALEHLHSHARDGQTIRYKVDHNFALVVKKEPQFDSSMHTIRESITGVFDKKDPDTVAIEPKSALPPKPWPPGIDYGGPFIPPNAEHTIINSI